MEPRRKINMGCGPTNFGKGWIHIDGGDYDHLDHDDITKLPYEEEIDLIYASHVIEYFDDEEVFWLLKEWKRVLKPEGKLQLAVPDLDELKQNLTRFIGPLYGKMKMGDKYIYHKTGYTIDRLRALLLFCGFRKVQWHMGPFYPKKDDCSHADISLNMEAIK